MKDFVRADSIVKLIWGKADTIMLIFAGAAAEFALNKSVDWLYFTGRLPADPLGRLFSTVEYSRKIIFSDIKQAHMAIDQMKNIHSAVENARGRSIPDSAYRDVLFMLIFYSISSFEVLERKLSSEEKEEIVRVFLNVGNRMNIPGLPTDYPTWISMYYSQQKTNLLKGPFTIDLYKQYRKHLGAFRYFLLIELQKMVVNKQVRDLLGFQKPSLIPPLLFGYKIFRKLRFEWFIKSLVLPKAYKERVEALDIN